MSGDKKTERAKAPAKGTAPGESKAPDKGTRQRDAEWTQGLKKLYNSVVDEPMPDSFRDLLSKLDDGE